MIISEYQRQIGSILGCLGPSWGHLGTISGHLKAILGLLGAILGLLRATWEHLGISMASAGVATRIQLNGSNHNTYK